MTPNSQYGDAEGPLGFPMPSPQAKRLDEILRSLPKDDSFAYRKLASPAALHEVTPGERADVSWISTEAPDRDGDMVLAAGLDDGQFAVTPVVTLNHAYHLPPVGLSLWRSRPGGGVRAKTYYPPRPDGWRDAWPPDECLALVRAGLLRGKSVGFLPLAVRPVTADEKGRDGRMKSVRHVVEKWLLLEYACCALPVQPFAVVEAVGKSAVPPLSAAVQKALGLDVPVAGPDFAALAASVGAFDWAGAARDRVDARLGRV